MHCLMKLTVIISVVFVTQVSASFFDVIQGAVMSVQTSFGKLISDVVSDVKEAIDCTILAVEHVLSFNDATDRYYDRCKTGNDENSPGTNNGVHLTTPLPILEVIVETSSTNLKETIPAEINDAVNETLTNILDGRNVKNRLDTVKDQLVKESESFADVSNLVKQEFDKLSSEATSDKDSLRKDSLPSDENAVNISERKEQNSKNISESIEIHWAVKKIFDKLDATEATEASKNNISGIFNDTNQEQNNNTKTENKPEIITLFSKYETLVTPRGETENSLSITSTRVTINIGTISEEHTNNTEQTVLTNHSEIYIEPSNSTSLLNNSFTSRTEYVTTISPKSTIDNILLKKLNINGVSAILENTTSASDLFIETTSELISTQTVAFKEFYYPDRTGEENIEDRKEDKHTSVYKESTLTTDILTAAIKTEESGGKNKTNQINNKINESFTFSPANHEDFNKSYETNNNLTSYHSESPLLDILMKSVSPGKDIISKIPKKMEEKLPPPPANLSNLISISTSEVSKESIIITTSKPFITTDQTIDKSDKISLDYDAFFNTAEKKSLTRKKGLQEALKLIQDSKKTEFIMNNILKRHKTGRSVFD